MIAVLLVLVTAGLLYIAGGCSRRGQYFLWAGFFTLALGSSVAAVVSVVLQ